MIIAIVGQEGILGGKEMSLTFMEVTVSRVMRYLHNQVGYIKHIQLSNAILSLQSGLK
jgi:hypothetical protein